MKHAVQGVVEALRVHAALPLDVSWNCIIVADDVGLLKEESGTISRTTTLASSVLRNRSPLLTC